MTMRLTTARNINSRAKSWLLVLLACVICNLGFTSTAESATWRDEFDAIAYSGNNGTNLWTGDWIEFGEANGPGSGFLRVVSSGNCTAGNCFRLGEDGSNSNTYLWREADLSGATTATSNASSSTRCQRAGWAPQSRAASSPPASSSVESHRASTAKARSSCQSMFIASPFAVDRSSFEFPSSPLR